MGHVRIMPRRSSREEIVFVSDFTLTPGLVLSLWAGGTALAASAIASWKIVGRGFFWVTIGSTALIGGATVAGGGALVWIAMVALLVAAVVASRPNFLAAALAVSGLSFAANAALDGGVLLAISGAVALGGVTSEMLLGHWYLVDPRLPRSALKRLDAAGAFALALDAALLIVAGAASDLSVVGWAFLALAALSVLLMVGVWFSLKEPSYPGVMAATGLSYLAVLTALGAVVAGRSLIGDTSNVLAAVVAQVGNLGS